MLVGGVVDEDVDPTKFGHGGADQFAAELLGPDVPRCRHCSAPRFLDQLRSAARIIILVEKTHDDVGAFSRERNGHGPPYARICAGHESAPAVETATAPIRVLPVVRLRHHLGGAPRIPDLFLFGERWRLVLLPGVLHAVLI